MGLSKEEKSAKCQILTKFSIRISLLSFENPSCAPHHSVHLCWKAAHGALCNAGIMDTGKIVTFENTGGRAGSRKRKCMKTWRLDRKQGGKWRPNSLGPLCFFFYPPSVYYFSRIFCSQRLPIAFSLLSLSLCYLLEPPLWYSRCHKHNKKGNRGRR